MTNIKAAWKISLDCDCPHCEEKFVDLLDYADFWEDHPCLIIPEHDTPRSTNMDVVCPECGGEFNVDCEY